MRKSKILCLVFYLAHLRLLIFNGYSQFGNLLVLQAAYQSPALKNMIAPQVLCDLITKTIRWLQTLAPISSALRKDAQILENAASKLDYSLQGRLSHY